MFNSPVSVFLWQQLPLVHLKVSHFNELRQLAEESISLVFSSLVNLNSSSLFSFVSSVSLTRWPSLLISVCVCVCLIVKKYVLETPYSAAWQGRLFPSVFVFIFLCVWQGETPHTAAAGKCRGSCFVFFFLCFCFCVFVWQGGTLEHLPLQQLDNGGGREEGIEWLANQLTAPRCYYVQIFIWKQRESSKACVC